MRSNSGYRNWGWNAIGAIVGRLPQEYVATNYTQVLGQYTRSRHPHVSLKRWVIDLPDGPGSYQMCATWVWKIEPGFIDVNIGGLLHNFSWGWAIFRGWDCVTWQGNTYNRVQSDFDVYLTTLMHQDPLFNDQRFIPQVIETFSARFVGAHASIQLSIDTLISIVIATSECSPVVHNLTIDALREALFRHNVWLSELQMQRILDEAPRVLSLRRLCSAQIRFQILSNSINAPPQNFFGGLSTYWQQTLSLDPRVRDAQGTPTYPVCWFHLERLGEWCWDRRLEQ
jgi:hypothetical protein